MGDIQGRPLQEILDDETVDNNQLAGFRVGLLRELQARSLLTGRELMRQELLTRLEGYPYAKLIVGNYGSDTLRNLEDSPWQTGVRNGKETP